MTDLGEDEKGRAMLFLECIEPQSLLVLFECSPDLSSDRLPSLSLNWERVGMNFFCTSTRIAGAQAQI